MDGADIITLSIHTHTATSILHAPICMHMYNEQVYLRVGTKKVSKKENEEEFIENEEALIDETVADCLNYLNIPKGFDLTISVEYV